MATEAELRDVKRRWSELLLSRPGVVGLGVDSDRRGGFKLTVFLADAEAGRGLPRVVEGHHLHFRIVGRLEEHAMASPYAGEGI